MYHRKNWDIARSFSLHAERSRRKPSTFSPRKRAKGKTTQKWEMAMGAHIDAIRDYYVATTAVVTGNVDFAPGVNVWFHTVIRGDLATITLGNRVNLQDGC